MATMTNRQLIFGVSLGLALVAGNFGSWLVQAQTSSPPRALEGQVENVRPGELPPRYQLGLELYVKNCSSCHLAIPVEVFPAETWRETLLQTYHYGKQVEIPLSTEKLLIWQYVRDFSRSLTEKEPTPYYFADSRYFRALHPKVTLPKPLNTLSCQQCHPGADVGNFRKLTAEWDTK